MPSTSSDTTRVEPGSTRTERKAQRRVYIRSVAQHLFDQRGFDSVTMAEVAAAASVSVQTVFNHFGGKEELFFDGRMPWVDGPALAVECRPRHVEPLAALPKHLVESVRQTVRWEATPGGRRYVAAIEASAALGSWERELVHESHRGLSAALTAAWVDESRWSAGRPSDDLTLLPGLVSAMWLAAVREVVVAHRPLDGALDERAWQAAMLAVHLLRHPSSVASAPDWLAPSATGG